MRESPFPIRGVVEGFYGTFFTFPERNALIRFLGKAGFNLYVYGPKNDRQHRMRWWDPYPPVVLDEFASTIATARASGVTFSYAISFGVPMNYASREDFAVVTGKFEALYARGCRSFGVFFDDLTDGFAHEVNRRRFRNVAEAHADCCNRLRKWLTKLDEPCSLMVCPTEYYGTAPFSDYLHDLGRLLHPAVEVFYTGPAIRTSEITREHVAQFAAAIRRPPLIWDNYPANDLSMRPYLHLGPLRGRDAHLYRECRGFVSNLMNQAEASKIALLTVAAYLRNPEAYDADEAWGRALLQVAGNNSYEPLRRVAENSLKSCLQAEEAPELSRLVAAALVELMEGIASSASPGVEALRQYLDVLDESIYHLRNRMENLALRQDMVPWIDALDEKVWLGRRALTCLEALEQGEEWSASLHAMEDLVSEVLRNPKSIGGGALLSLADHVRERTHRASAGLDRGSVWYGDERGDAPPREAEAS